MKVLFVSPSFYPATYYGGPIFINRALCESLARNQQIRLEVLTTDADGPKKRIDAKSVEKKPAQSYPINYCRRIFPPDIAPGLLLRLFRLIRQADIVHLNGVYSFTTIPTLALCRLMRKPVVWSTLGALQRWQATTHPGMKRIWEGICDSLCEPDRVVLHLTSEADKNESLEKIRNAGTIVLCNGIDVAEAKAAKSFMPDGCLRLLFIGRLHPIKGIETLLHALFLTRTRVALSICGQGEEDYETYIRSLVIDLDLSDRVRVQGQVDGPSKERQFQLADVCVVPSFKESFGTVVVESLARGVPVIVSRGTPWQKVEEIGCGLWVSNEAQELAVAIDRVAKMPLAEMGLRGRAWMQRDFSWSQITNETIVAYQRLIQNQSEEQLAAMTSPKAV